MTYASLTDLSISFIGFNVKFYFGMDSENRKKIQAILPDFFKAVGWYDAEVDIKASLLEKTIGWLKRNSITFQSICARKKEIYRDGEWRIENILKLIEDMEEEIETLKERLEDREKWKEHYKNKCRELESRVAELEEENRQLKSTTRQLEIQKQDLGLRAQDRDELREIVGKIKSVLEEYAVIVDC